MPPIAYRGFAVAPITLRPSQRNLTVPPSPAPLPKDLPPRGRGTARRRWKEFPPASGGRSSFPPSPLTGFTRRSRPPALPPIAYRGFAVAPITLRPLTKKLARSLSPRPPSSREGDRPQAVEGVLARRRWKEFSRIARPITLRTPSRSPLYNPGCRVATLLVSMGVMGFLGDLREDRSRARPVGGSVRRSIPSEREQPCCDL